MREANIKAFFLLLIFFLLDILKPFGYSLLTEFTFIGIIFVALNYPLFISIALSVLFGYLKDALSPNAGCYCALEFSLIAAVVNYFLYNFRKKAVKTFIFAGAICIHIVINNFYINKAAYLFSFIFLIHSCAIFLIVNKLLGEWLCNGRTKGYEI